MIVATKSRGSANRPMGITATACSRNPGSARYTSVIGVSINAGPMVFFEAYDILATPALPVTAFDVGRNIPPGHEDRDAVSWVYYSYPFNLTGQPAVSVNAGFDADGLPVGLQLVARSFAEETLFSLAAAFEEYDPELDRRPSR